MKPGYYMHRHCLDVCIENLGQVDETEDSLTLKVMYLNLGYMGSPYILPYPNKYNIISHIRIKKENVNNWVDISDKITVKRTSPGLP
jgi:hypothetical protein